MEEQNYKLLRGQHFKGGRIYTAGELVPLTDEEFRVFENKFALVVTPTPAPTPTETPAETGKGKTGKGKTAKSKAETAEGDPGEDGDPGMGEGGE